LSESYERHNAGRGVGYRRNRLHVGLLGRSIGSLLAYIDSKISLRRMRTRLNELTSYISREASLPAPGRDSTYFIRSWSSTEPTFANGRPTMITQRPRLSEKLIPDVSSAPMSTTVNVPSESLPPTTAKSNAPFLRVFSPDWDAACD